MISYHTTSDHNYRTERLPHLEGSEVDVFKKRQRQLSERTVASMDDDMDTTDADCEVHHHSASSIPETSQTKTQRPQHQEEEAMDRITKHAEQQDANYFRCRKATDIPNEPPTKAKILQTNTKAHGPRVSFAQAQPHKAKKNQVSFHQVTIRRYPMIMGDNPSVQIGTPVTLDWVYDELPPLDFEAYESTRLSQRRTKLRNLLLNYYHREALLERQGYSLQEQQQADQQASKIRFQRQVTAAMLPFAKVEEVLQSAKRKIKRRLQPQA